MNRISAKGGFKEIYYEPNNLTAEELTRYFQFTPMLTTNQIQFIKDWCIKNTTRFALVDEDYIFFTLKSEHDLFVEFWLAYNSSPNKS